MKKTFFVILILIIVLIGVYFLWLTTDNNQNGTTLNQENLATDTFISGTITGVTKDLSSLTLLSIDNKIYKIGINPETKIFRNSKEAPPKKVFTTAVQLKGDQQVTIEVGELIGAKNSFNATDILIF